MSKLLGATVDESPQTESARFFLRSVIQPKTFLLDQYNRCPDCGNAPLNYSGLKCDGVVDYERISCSSCEFQHRRDGIGSREELFMLLLLVGMMLFLVSPYLLVVILP